MPHIRVIQPEEAEGELAAIYADLVSRRGKIAEVHKIQSLHPDSIVKHMELYMTIMFGASPLKRVQREMMAVVVSKANDCEYCQVHHAEAVLHYWKDPQQVEILKQNFRAASLSPADLALCEYAHVLTLDPARANDVSLVGGLSQLGFSDRAILDATLVISYFNFVNRIVMALGVGLEEDPGGYKYE